MRVVLMADNPNPNPAQITPFGVLNDVSKPAIRKRFNPLEGNTIEAMTVAAAEAYTPDTMKGHGQFKAIVLRVSMPTQLTEPGSSWWNFFAGPDPPAVEPPLLVKIKARVPEIHSMLPIPSALGPEGDHKTINMYPTFVAQSTAVQIPEPGDIVWVDWQNRETLTGPYYIRPVLEVGTGNAPVVGGPGALDSHRNCAGNSYNASRPTGDSIAGSNAPAVPFTGLPRLKRIPKSNSQAKPAFIKDVNVDPVSSVDWEKASTGLPPGMSMMWGSKHNGVSDPDHKHQSRMSLIWYPHTMDWSQDWELIYWFHGLEGFSKKNFEKRIAPQLKKMVEQGRNFVFVKPELPWSIRGTGKKRGARQKGAWEKANESSWGGNFESFHNDVIGQLPSNAGNRAALITIYGHSNGGSAIARAATEGALQTIKPKRIFFSDSDYGWGFSNGGAIGHTWEKYAKNHPDVWFTALTIDGHTPRKLATKFFLANKNQIADRPVYHIETDKSHKWCGDNALSIISEEHRKRILEKEKENSAAAAEAEPDDDQGQENAAAIAEANLLKQMETIGEVPEEPPKKDKSGEAPVPQKPPEAPSENSKSSSNAQLPSWESIAAELTGGISEDPAAPDFKTTAAVTYEENRVKVADYGGALLGEEANKLLEEVEPNVKLHKLAAKRYRAFKAAAIAAGFKDFRISSGWREHKWASREAYEAKMIAEYGSVAEGRKWRAFNSPHELGLAMDVKAHGVYASAGGSQTKSTQEKTDLFIWMKDHAHRFGLTPYKREPWHWELRLPYAAYASGQDFTEDMAARVTDIGTVNSQLPSVGPSYAQSAAPCVGTNGGVGGTGGSPYTAGVSFSPAPGGGDKPQTFSAPGPGLGFSVHPEKGPTKMHRLQMFMMHETGGYAHELNSMISKINKRPVEKYGYTAGCHFWVPGTAELIQTIPVTRRTNHGNNGAPYSCGMEVCIIGVGHFKPEHKSLVKAELSYGMHYITHKGAGWGDIASEPGKVCAASPNSTYQLSLPAQLETAWKTVLWVHGLSGKKDPDNPNGATVIDVPIEFPCVREGEGKFWWTKWNGGPTNYIGKGDPSPRSASNWWSIYSPNRTPKDEIATKKPRGISCHGRNSGHYDGWTQVYYCLARAGGMTPNDAFWATVGALCSGEKATVNGEKGLVWTPTPNAKMRDIGKSRYPAAWFNAKTIYHFGRRGGKKTRTAWAAAAKSNSSWFVSTTALT